jgi:isopenicillin-N epimerase
MPEHQRPPLRPVRRHRHRLWPTLRRLFQLDDAATFLNHGSFGLTPLAVLATQAALREEMERQPVQFLNRATLQPRLRAAAAQLAGFLGVAAEDLVFVDNATTGVNAVLRSFPLVPGDEVLITDHTYPAVRNAVRFVCGRAGARMVEARLPFPAESRRHRGGGEGRSPTVRGWRSSIS